MIEHSNIIYMPVISALGGIETYVYELVKKYHYLDIGVVCTQIDEKQRIRISKYAPIYIHKKQRIKCDVAIINYDQSIINYIDTKADIYETVHADYTSGIYSHQPKPHPRIKSFIMITKYLYDRMDYLDNRIMSYNPLTVDKKDFITIVSATRLHNHKGSKRMLELARALDRLNIDFIWYVLTNDIDKIEHPNMIPIKPRLDVYKFLKIADYVCLLSDSEACSYTINEALYRNIPVIVTPLPYLEEIGYKDNLTGYTIKFDCSNVEEVAKKMVNIPKFEYRKLEDKYNEIFTNKRTNHKEVNMIEVEALDTYEVNNISDGGLGYVPRKGEHFKVSKDRLDTLLGNNAYNKPFVKVVETEEKEVAPKPKEERAVLPKKNKKK